ncbi:MAG: hypothetical protein ACRDJH_14615 [Thermomicrobiales bacterium]
MPATEFKEDPDALEHFLFDPEEGRQMFDEAAREWVGMSGEEFIRRWEAGEFAEIPDDEAHRRYVDLVLMIPLACQES